MARVGNKTNVLLNSAAGKAKVEVEESSTEIVKENEAREGLEIVNDSTATVYLMLGKAAVLKEGYALAPKGSWDGKAGTINWFGSVFGIATAAKSVVTITEL